MIETRKTRSKLTKVRNVAALTFALVLGLSACSSEAETETASTELNIYGWAGEIPDTVIAAFEAETGIKVTFDTFDSNETMISKLAAGNSGYDIVEPSQYAVQILVGQGLVQPIDYSKVEGKDNLRAKFINPSYDPENKYSLPWVWGTTGLLYNQACTGEEITSWSSLFDEKYKGKINMLDNMLAAYIPALQVNGLSATTTTEADVEVATQTLLTQKSLLAGYNSDTYGELVASGDVCLSLAWGGSQAAQAVQDNPDVKYILPKEGGTLWVDGFAIAKDAPNLDAAYKWLNFTLRPEIAAMATDDGNMATVNGAALDLVKNQDLLNSAAIFAPDEMLANSEFIVDKGDALAFFTDRWTKVKAS
jgi:spermidine/putrescine transport system substrate-binding protein